MGITGGFGITMDLERGTMRHWVMGRDGVKRWADNGEQVDRPTEKRMTFDEWADKYALDDEPCTRQSRRQDCEAAWKAATEQAIEAMQHLDYGRWSKDEISEHVRVFCAQR